MAYPPIFDGHNDTILAMLGHRTGQQRDFFKENETGHIDLPRARKGGLGGGFFAMFTPSRQRVSSPLDAKAPSGPYEIPLPPPLDHTYALEFTMSAAATLLRTESASNGEIKIVRTVGELESCLRNGTFAILLHIEGAESIDTEFHSLHVLYQMGLRSLGLVWSRPTAFGSGVPFKFPASPDIGPGLTSYGKALVKQCNQLGILVDLSHLNENGFWDVASLSNAPLVATHSGVYELSKSPRNLTDKQLDAIKESGGIVGVNFHTGFLRADGQSGTETSLVEIVNHATYIAERIGVDHVALGSDFDGAVMPQDLGDAAGLPKLMKAFQEKGFDAVY